MQNDEKSALINIIKKEQDDIELKEKAMFYSIK
jgi:hypothetical protein